MSNRPFMQLYVSDFVGDTMHLSAEQVGAYMLLLMAMWNAGGHLADDDVKLARIVRMTVKRWRAVAPDIMCFFSRSDGTVTHRRLSEEIEKIDRKSELRAAAGSSGGKAKALKEREPRLANARVLPCHFPEPDIREDSSLRSLSRPVASDTDQREIAPDERKIGDQGAAPKRSPSRSPAAPTEHPDFAAFWQTYPKRLGTNSRAGAAERFWALAKSGVEPGALIDGARRYRRQCEARGIIKTEFVQQATTWLNPKTRAWEEDYELPDTYRQTARGDRGKPPTDSGDPLLAAVGARLSRVLDGGRPPSPASGFAGGGAGGDPRADGDDRGEYFRDGFGSNDRFGRGDAFCDAAPEGRQARR